MTETLRQRLMRVFHFTEDDFVEPDFLDETSVEVVFHPPGLVSEPHFLAQGNDRIVPVSKVIPTHSTLQYDGKVYQVLGFGAMATEGGTIVSTVVRQAFLMLRDAGGEVIQADLQSLADDVDSVLITAREDGS